MKNQTMDESSLLNLEFLEAELQTFIDGFPFKGFYFPIRFEINIKEVESFYSRLIQSFSAEKYIHLIQKHNQSLKNDLKDIFEKPPL